MANNTNSLTYLHIEDKYEELSKDIKVSIPTLIVQKVLAGNKLTSDDLEILVNSASNAVLSRYIDTLDNISSHVYLMIPVPIDKDELIKAYENQYVEEAKTKVDDIFAGLSEEQRAILINHINSIKPNKVTK